jgi:hypothetical protein
VARRKRKGEDSPGFSPPEFDEVDYMRREIAGAKASILVVLWALVGGLLAYGMVLGGLHWAIAFLLGLGTFLGLQFVMPTFGVHSEKFVRRDWIGHGATYFFSWLAFWILLLNAPFSDFTSPTIHGILVGTYDSAANPGPGNATVACVAVFSQNVVPPTELGNDTILVIFRASDNVGISSPAVTVEGAPATAEPAAGSPHACASRQGVVYPIAYPSDTYLIRIPISGGSSFDVTVRALDARGHLADARFTISP